MTIPDTHHWNGSSYQTILSTAETGGTLSILCVTAPPHSGPPSHIHAAEDEVFIILSGTVDFAVGDRRLTCGPLQTAFVPRGVAHSFRTGPQGARGLTILTPGGFEGFFADMAALDLSLPADMEAVRAIAGRYGSRFVGPGLAQTAAQTVAQMGGDHA
jgi:mannose-6-phosphate isomerase-like protein (cupin superfamily)